MVKCIIVEDDEVHSRNLKRLLAKAEESFDVVATCENIEDSVLTIINHKPELVFLDIALGTNEKGGFEVLKRTKSLHYDVIFTTSHIDPNINQIRMFGLDCISKTYVQGELNEAIKKFQDKKGQKTGAKQITSFVNNLLTESMEEQEIWLTEKNISFPVKVRNIFYCTTFEFSNGEYTNVFFHDEEQDKRNECTSTHGLGEWAKFLEPYRFCRIHKQHVINIRKVARYINGDGGEVIMKDGKHFDVSKTGKPRLQKLMKML